MLRLRDAWLAVVVTAAACSPVSDPSNVPDAAIDAPDTTPPMLVSSNPANMQQHVSVLSPISLFFDRRLDPATVNMMTVRIRYVYSQYAAGFTFQYAKVSYDDAANKISIEPSLPMYNSARYEVIVDGVKDLSGNVVNNARVSFFTYYNAALRTTYYNVTSGVITQAYANELDADGRLAKGVYKNGVGPDMMWHTADDVTACCPYGYVYGPDGRMLEQRSWGAAGPDAKFNTPDDVLTNLYKYEYDAMGLMTTEGSVLAGPDTLLGTADDVPQYYQTYQYMNGFQTSYAFYDHPGPDNVWKTADDRTQNAGNAWGEYTVDSFGNRTRQIYRQVGPDMTPKTADDFIYIVYDYEYDSYGYQTKQVYKNAAGPDAMWLTADDVVGSWSKIERDASGAMIGRWSYSAIGPDAMWFTADDVPSSHQVYINNADKIMIDQTNYNAGPDTIWGNADDVPTSYTLWSVDGNGNKIEQRSFGAGPDGKVKTADDRVSYDNDLNTTK
jgi:hypothetical protein